MPKIGNLFVSLGMDTARFDSDTKKAKKSFNSLERRMGRSARNMRKQVNSVGKSFVSLGGIISGVAGVGALGALTKSSFESADALAKTSDKLGIMTDKLVGLQNAGELTGVSTNTMNMALQRMTRRLSEAANGTGEAQGAIKELGLDAEYLASLSPDQAFSKIADAMGNVSNQGDKVRLAMKFFDSEGVALVNTLKLGSNGLDEMTMEAERLGVSLSRVDAAKIEAANDSVFKSKQVFKGLGNTIAVNVAPYVEAIGNSFNKSAMEANGFKDEVNSSLQVVVKSVGFVADAFRGLNVVFVGFKTVFAGVADFLIGTSNKIIQSYTSLRKFFDSEYEPPDEHKILGFAATSATKRYGMLKKELAELVAQPMPSENIEAWAKKVQEEADKASAQVEQTKKSLGTINPVREQGSQGFDTEQSQLELEALGAKLLAEEERIAESYLKRKFIVENAYQDGLITEQKRSDRLKQIETDKQNKLTAIHKAATEKRKRQEQVTQSAQLGIVSNALGAISSTMDSNNRKQFENQKKLGIASALINTYKAIAESLGAYPFPFNAVAAAASAALGYAQVKNIKSQSFGGGGSAPSVGGASGNVVPTPTPGQPPENPLAPNNDIPQPARQINITLNGSAVGSEGVRDLIAEINEEIGDDTELKVL